MILPFSSIFLKFFCVIVPEIKKEAFIKGDKYVWQDINNSEKELNVENDGKEKVLEKIKERCKKWRKKEKE